jgi:photosystem II stability/assembly factor-like uncharacterized protein
MSRQLIDAGTRSSQTLSALRVVFVLICIFAGSSRAPAQEVTWARQYSGTLAWLHSVFFLDQNRGFVVGSRGTMLVTADGGKQWQQKELPTTDVIKDIYFLDEQTGWILCERNIYDLRAKGEARTYLMKTTDGGERWLRVNVRGADVDSRLIRAVFKDGGRAWAFGEGGAIYATSDFGKNWTKLIVPTRHLLLGGTFVDEYRGWVVGAGATILQTSDGGNSWHLSRLAGAEDIRFTAASFVDNRVGWAVGSNGAIYRTLNGGRTWSSQNSGSIANLLDVKFINNLEGWAVGNEGTVIYTNDGGLNWERQRTATDHPLERIFFTDRTHGWAVGFGGTILTYVRAEAPQMRR